MRRVLVVLALVTSACAVGAGVDPDAAVVTTASASTSTTIDEQDRLNALEVVGRLYDAALARNAAVVAALTLDPPASIGDDLANWADGIGLIAGTYSVSGEQYEGNTATIAVDLELDLREVGPWSYETSVTLVGGGPWAALWSPTVLHPALEPGDRIRVDKEWQPRASILAADGTELAGAAEVKVIGVVPAWIEDLDSLTADLARLAGIEPGVVSDETSKPGVQPDWFVPVGSVDLSEYDRIGPEIESLPGVVVRDGSERVAFGDGFAEHIVGSVGPITADQLEELGFPYGPTDLVGRTGLELAFESQLAGRPSVTISRVNRFGRVAEQLLAIEGRSPQPLQTTIDTTIQSAIELALGESVAPAAVVVIDSSTGDVRGAASRPVAEDFNRALSGAYPPGSTFKIITATALLRNGYTVATEVDCPSQINLGGKVFRNAGSVSLGTVTLSQAFAASCNTAFAGAAVAALDGPTLRTTAESFGLNSNTATGLPAISGAFPEPTDTAELAAAAIGQGRVLVSPVHMASVAAAIDSGIWRSPRLIATDEVQTTVELDRAAASAVAEMMLAVVTSGTGTNAAVPGVEVRGKTGSAEFGTGESPGTHAWFVGYWDDLAIAVLVEGGGGGGSVAAPIAAQVISLLES